MDQPIDRRAAFKAALAVGLAGTGGAASAASEPSPTPVAAPSRGRLTLDMVQPNPGQPPPQTAYLDPAFLRARSYGAVVIEHAIEGTATFDAYDPGLIPKDSDEARLAGRLRGEIAARIAAAKSQGLAAYAWVQYLVLPKRLLARHGAAMVDAAGRIDLARPATQAVVAAFTRELLFTFPNLDGLVVRTGEIYLQDLPYHAARVAAPGAGAEDAIQAATAIIHGEQSHLALLSVLRQEVCVAAGRRLIYRTWDFGDNFHNNVRYYLGVTDRIEPPSIRPWAGGAILRSSRPSASWRPMARAPIPIMSPAA